MMLRNFDPIYIAKQLGLPRLSEEQEAEIRASKPSRESIDSSGKDITNSFYGKKHTQEVKDLVSARNKTRVGSKNGMFGRKHSEETRKKISEKATGRPGHTWLVMSDASKQQISQSKKAGNWKWWNDGTKSLLAFECPEGFVRGRLPWVR